MLNDYKFFKKFLMKNNMKKILTIFGLFVFVYSLNAQSIGRVGTTAAPFLKISVGARALAMGEAYTTIAEDVTGLFWNPAGISKNTGMQILFNHYDYIADLTYDFGGVTLPLTGVGTFGVFMGYLGMPDIERTTIQFPDGTGERVSASSFVIGLGFARELTDRFSIGGNVKYIRENIWHMSADAYAFDVGVLYRTFFKNIRIGMSISNFGSQMQMGGRDVLVQHDINDQFEGNNENINANLETEQFPLPILFRVGISANILEDFFELQDYDWIVAVDAIHPNDNKEYLNTGTEFKLYDLVALRAGYRQLMLDNAEGGLTFGVGLNLEVMNYKINLDYANIDFGRLDHQNKFTLILSF
jgi:hypothetical protein